MCNVWEEAKKTWDTGVNTVQNVINNPMPIITMAAATWVLGPAGTGLVSASIAPVLAAGTIAASQGRNIGEIAKSSLLAYGSSNFASVTGAGDITKYVGSQIGGVTGSMATAGLNNAFFNSTVAAVGGKDVGQAFGAGFVGGAAGAAAGAAMTSEMGKSFFGDVKDSFGLSDTQMKYIKGATLATSTAALSGQDPTKALSNYIAQNISNYGKKEFNEFLDSAKKSYQDLSDRGETLKTSQENYEAVKSQYDNKLSEAEKLRQSINQDSVDLQKLVDEKYTPFVNEYDVYKQKIEQSTNTYNIYKKSYDEWLDAYNHYAPLNFFDKPGYMNMLAAGINERAQVANTKSQEVQDYSVSANKLYENNKSLIDDIDSRKSSIDKKVADFQTFKSDIETPNQDGTNLAAKFLAASNDLQLKFDQFTTSKQNVDEISKQYITKLAEIGRNEEAAQAEAAKPQVTPEPTPPEVEPENKPTVEPDVTKTLADAGLKEEPLETKPTVEPENVPTTPDVTQTLTDAGLKEEPTVETKPDVVPKLSDTKPEEKPNVEAVTNPPVAPDVVQNLKDAGLKTEEPVTVEPKTTQEVPDVTQTLTDAGLKEEPWTPPTDLPPATKPTGLDNEKGVSESGVLMPDGSFKTWAQLDELAGVPSGTIYTDGGSTITQQELQDILNGTYKPRVTPPTPKPTTPEPKPTTPEPKPTTPAPITKPVTQPVAQPAQQSNNLGMLALLDILGQPQQQPQQQTQQPVEGAKIELMEDIFGNNFFTPRPEGAKKYSSGGEIEALLHLLRS